MKKKLTLFFVIGMLFCLVGKAAQTEINLASAGTLKAKLLEQHGALSSITALKVTGNIDARDFRTCRDDLTALVELDLSEASIVSYSGTEGTNYTVDWWGIPSKNSETDYEAHVVPPYALYCAGGTNMFGEEIFPESRPKLQNLKLPSGITKIENSALSKLENLSSTILDLSIYAQLKTLEVNALQEGKFKEVKLPASLTSIGWGAFNNCSALTSFTIPASVIYLGSGVFIGCSELAEIKFAEPSNITTLEFGFFVGLPKLMKVEIPASVTDVGEAFVGSSSAFSGTEIKVAANNPNYSDNDGILYNKNKDCLVFCPTGKNKVNILASTLTIGRQAFCFSNFTKLTIPKSIKTIGQRAFYNSQIEEILFESPAALETIDEAAFSGTPLKTIEFPASLKTIGREAFSNNAVMKNITLPSGITSVGMDAFSNCSLESANLSAANALTTLSGGIFRNSVNLSIIQLPSQLAVIQSDAFSGCTALHALSLPSTLKTIGMYAFISSGIKSLTLPEGLTEIGEGAFMATPMTSLSIPSTVSDIAPSAFSNTSIRISVHANNATYSSSNGILYNKNKTTLLKATGSLSGKFVVPSTVTRIESDALSFIGLLTSIDLPAGLTDMGFNVFYGSSQLKRVIARNPTPITIYYTFDYGLLNQAVLCVPAASLEAYKAAEEWKYFADIKPLGFFHVWEYPDAGAVSPDGKWVVGYHSFRWENKRNGDDALTWVNPGGNLTGVNNAGVIAGDFSDTNYMVMIDEISTGIPSGGVYKNGEWHSLGLGRYGKTTTNHEVGSHAYAITENGWVFGSSYEKNDVARLVPIVWKPNASGAYTDTVVYRFPEDELPIAQRHQGACFLSASSDGSVAGGWSTTKESFGLRRPIIWTSPTKYKVFETTGVLGAKISPNGKYAVFEFNAHAALYDIEKDSLTVFGVMNTRPNAVSNDGTVVGYRIDYPFKNSSGETPIGNGVYYGFIWSDRMGYVEMDEFFDKYAPEIVLPSDFSFNEKDDLEGTLDNPTDISADGRLIVGLKSLSQSAGWSWVFELPATLNPVNRPRNLTASVNPRTARDVVELSWIEPAPNGDLHPDFYYIYRDRQYIGMVDANGPDGTSYTDREVLPGYPQYMITAVYDAYGRVRESGYSETAYAAIADTHELPFYDNFDSKYFETNFWKKSGELTSASWNFTDGGFHSLQSAAAFTTHGSKQKYSCALTSKLLNGNNADKVTASFVYTILEGELAPVGIRDTVYLEVSADGNVWNVAQKYILYYHKDWTPESVDITSWAKGKMFQVRFRVVSGENRNVMAFVLDDFSVIIGKPKTPQGVKAVSNTPEKVGVRWQNPAGSYELTYAKSRDGVYIGNEGSPIIAVNRFPVEALKYYQDLKLTSISAPISYFSVNNIPTVTETKIALAVYVDGVRVVNQPIDHFEAGKWNTFPLNVPIEISKVKKELMFGIEVLKHDENALPLGVDLAPSELGLSDLFSEDNGRTWQMLRDYFGESTNWCIVANLRTSPAEVEYTNNILGYEIYRNGTKINHPLTLNFSTYFIDDTKIESPCYTVQAFYQIGGYSELSEMGCTTLDGIKSVFAGEIAAYPNPTTGMVYIQSKEGEMSKIVVSNVLGEQLLRTTGNSVDLSRYPNGIYVLEVDGQILKVMKK